MPDPSKLSQLLIRKKDLTSNVVAELFNALLKIRSANARRAKPDMSEFMEQGKCPCGLGILIVDYDEGCDAIGKCKASKDFRVECSVMSAQVTDQKHKDTGLLSQRTEISKCVLNRLSASEFTEIESKLLGNLPGCIANGML
ncbi:hypothetical protein AU476_27125 [Cupriavidus sp. UYMSc13B]|nr:hypothetical protein AU476_27125 [Cupriavidus sp. UYMSc13B]